MSTDPNVRDSDYLKRPDAGGHLKVLHVLRKWDPIGVADESPDEYDAYAGELIRMLDHGATVDNVVNWMRDLATRHMGLSHVEERLTRDCAQELVDYWRA